jgi:phage tail sheath protein FI
VRVTALGDENPDTVTAQALTGGDDDRANATDTQWEDALEVFSRGLGPGQVSYAGRTSATAHQQLLEHAAANNRVALLDALNSSDVLDLTDVPGDAVTDPDQARFGAAFAPWIRIPGVAASTTRIVPPSALVAGLIARSDAVQTPNQPAAGENGVARWALGPEHTFTDSTYSDLHDANLNMVRLVAGQPRVYGWRSLESKDLARWWQFNTSRLRMLVQAELEVIGERYMFRQVDGRGAVLAAFSGEITSMLLGQYEAGAIYGDTPGEAFRVDVGPSVNSPEDLAQGRVGAVAAIRPSPHGELIEIELVRRSITEPV